MEPLKTDSQLPGATPPSAPQPAPPVSNSPMPLPPAPDAMEAAAAAAPDIADDGDLIEKEWVSQAKAIIHNTANDPFQQNAQFSKLKTEYLQKRYGKQVKSEY